MYGHYCVIPTNGGFDKTKKTLSYYDLLSIENSIILIKLYFMALFVSPFLFHYATIRKAVALYI